VSSSSDKPVRSSVCQLLPSLRPQTVR